MKRPFQANDFWNGYGHQPLWQIHLKEFFANTGKETLISLPVVAFAGQSIVTFLICAAARGTRKLHFEQR
jgi:hypothetical protein